MKQNILLGFILCSLLVLAYYSEEIYKSRKERNQKISISLIKDIKLESITFPKSEIVKDGKLWTVTQSPWPLDQSKVEFFINILQSIEVKAIVGEGKNKDFFRKGELEFSVGAKSREYKFILGDASEATGRFYIFSKAENKTYLCEDSSSLSMLHSSERDYNLKKFLRLRHFLDKGKEYFWESNFSHALNINKIDAITIDSQRNRKLELDFSEASTEPPIYSGLRYKNFEEVLNSYFSKVRVTEVIEQKQSILTDLKSTLTINAGMDFVLKYYAGLNEEYGRFIKISGFNLIFRVEMDDQNLFFLSAQDFWEKKIPLEESIVGLTTLPFQLSNDSKNYYHFEVYDLEQFKIRASLKNIVFSKVHMNVLFNLLLNLSDFKEAKYVHKDKINEENLKNCLFVKLLGGSFAVTKQGNMIKVFDLKRNLTFLFPENSGQTNSTFFTSTFTVNSK